MNFYIEKLILWLNDGTIRTMDFMNDKINIVTGNSKTGKTAILEIIDYCFCGNKETATISYEDIGENVNWYGIRFRINEKIYTIARGAITNQGKEFSSDYFFSQTGEIPDLPYAKTSEHEIKSILEPEFSINDTVAISYGSRSTRKFSYLSFRYFLMFNTISKDIIDNGHYYFDKLHIERYSDSWHQVFDLALDIIDFNIARFQKRLADLQQEVNRLEQDIRKSERNQANRSAQIGVLVKKAKEAHIIDALLSNDDAYAEIIRIINDKSKLFLVSHQIDSEYVTLQNEREKVALQLRKLTRFKRSYEEYKTRLRTELDELRPVNYIQNHFGERISGEYRIFLQMLSKSMTEIKRSIKEIRPFEYDVSRKISELSESLHEIDARLIKMTRVNDVPVVYEDKLITFGEIKSELKHIDNPIDITESIAGDIASRQKEIDDINERIQSVREKRQLTIGTLNEYIQTYIAVSRDALGKYGDYFAWFDYEKSSLSLRKEKSSHTANISSSSDHLFMHLCLFAGLHEMLVSQESKFVPPFLVIDQPSRPYYNTDSDYNYENSEAAIAKKDDWSKVRNIFSLLDSFLSNVFEKGKHFQIIVLEHVSERAWETCNYVNLVEIFDGVNNALIPTKYTE